jgi:hypothetical protein
MGVGDANAALEQNCETSIDNLIHYHAMKKSGDERILKHTYGSFLEAKAKGEMGEYDIMEDDLMRKYTYKMFQ